MSQQILKYRIDDIIYPPPPSLLPTVIFPTFLCFKEGFILITHDVKFKHVFILLLYLADNKLMKVMSKN